MGGQQSSAADIHVKTIQHWQLHKRKVKELNHLKVEEIYLICLPRLCLHCLVAQRLAHSQIAIHADPHEGVHGDSPEGDLQIPCKTAHNVAVHPFSCERGIHGEWYHQQAA